MQTLKGTFQITKKDLLEFIRDKLRIITFFLMPIFMMILVGFIFPSQNSLKNIPIGVANLDKSIVGQKLTETIQNLKISDNQTFKVKTYGSIDEIKEGIKKQEINGGVLISSDFGEKLNQNQQVQVTIVEDQTNPQISALTNQILSQTINGFGKGLGVQKLGKILVQKTVISPQPAPVLSPAFFLTPITVAIQGIIGGNPNYFEFVAPGIIAMIVMTAVLTGLAASVSREKEQGTLDGILIAPVSRLAIILGKAFAQSIRGMIQGAIVLILAILLFGVTVHGNILLMALVVLLGVFSFVGLGILVSASASEQETATQILFMFQFPMLFLSGVFFPIQQMPKAMQYIAHLLPLTYAVQAMRKVMILGAGFAAIRTELVILFVFGAVMLIIAVPLFKRIIIK